MMQSRIWLPAVVLLSFARSIAAGYGGNYSFVLFWPQAGVAADADAQFNNIFRPQLAAQCLASGVALPDGFSVRFTESILPSSKPTFSYFSSVASTLATDGGNYTFAGTTGTLAVDTRRLLQATGNFSQLHWIEAPPLTALASSLFAVIREVQRSGAVSIDVVENRMLVAVVGLPYRLADVQQLLRSFEFGVLSFGITATDIVATIEKSSITTILVIANRVDTMQFLYNALEGVLWSPDYRWILYDSGLIYQVKPNLLLSTSRNITSVDFGPYTMEQAAYLTTSEQVMLYDLLNIWTAFMANQTCNANIESQPLKGLTGQFLLSANGTVTRQDWQMLIYRNLLSSSIVVGNISSSGAFKMTPTVSRSGAKDEILKEYRDVNINIYVIPGSQYVRYKKGMEKAFDVPLRNRLEGMVFDLCMEIFANLRLTNLTVVIQPDMNYGLRVNGEWNGLVKSLIDGSADFACADLTVSKSRKKDIDFTAPYLTTNVSILYKAKTKDPNKEIFQFFFPLSSTTWLYLCVALISVALLLTILHRISPNQYPFDLKYSMFFSFASLVQGVVGHPPDRPSGRIVVIAYWTFVILLLVAYVSNYAAIRALERMEVTIENVFSLIDQSTYTYGTLANSSIANSFETSSFSDMKLAYERMRKFKLGFFADPQVGFAAVTQGSYAMIFDTPSNQYAQQLGCQLVVTGFYQTTDLAFGLPRRSDLRTLVEDELKRLIANRRVYELYTKYFVVPLSSQPDCDSQTIAVIIPDEPDALSPEVGALTLRNTFGLLIINVIGCSLTLLVAGAEYAFARLKRSKEKMSFDEMLALGTRPRGRNHAITNVLNPDSSA